jgi:hypothetical protein
VTVGDFSASATCYAGSTGRNRPEADEANNELDSIVMNRKSFFLSIEALILGGPTSLLFILGSPYILIGSFYTLAQGNPLALIGTVSCLWSLLQYWKLAFSTIFETKYKFGIGFVLALLGAVSGALVMHVGVPDLISVALIGFPCVGMLHFIYEQLRLHRLSLT